MSILLAVIATSESGRAGEHGERLRCAAGEPLRIAVEEGLGFTVFSARDLRIGRIAESCAGWLGRHLARGGAAAATFVGEAGDRAEIAVEPIASNASFWVAGVGPSWTGLYG